jgi:hypothetical protein
MAFFASFEFSYIAEWRGPLGGLPDLTWAGAGAKTYYLQKLSAKSTGPRDHAANPPENHEVKECVGYRPLCLFKLPNQKFNLTLNPKFLTGTSPGTNVVYDTRHTPEYNIQSSDQHKPLAFNKCMSSTFSLFPCQRSM